MTRNKNYPCQHWQYSAIARLSKMPSEAKTTTDGWVYAMACRAKGLEDVIKFGGTGKCPYCRADEYCKTAFPDMTGMDVLALRPSGDWRADEQVLLNHAGRPFKGKEWFDNKDDRLRWVLKTGFLKTVEETEQVCRHRLEQFIAV
jgi:hypothetical protein